LRRLLIWIAAAVLLVLLGAVGGLAVIGRVAQPSSIDAVRHELPSAPLDIEVVDGHTGYATLGDGRIIRFELDGESLDWAEVASGLRFPRGLAVDDETVYAVEMGELSCEPAYPTCHTEDAEAERERLADSSGRVVAYGRNADGSLGDGRTLLDGIPVVGRDHGPNDIDMGPDGRLYLSVGNLDYSWSLPYGADAHPNADWVGTVLRIDPTSGEADVYARGLRNVYGLTFEPGGELLGVDNDGPALRGWRDEELVEIREGADHGYPSDPSIGPGSVRTGWPIMLLQSTASAGIAWDEDGVLIGNCGTIQRIPLTKRDGAFQLNGQRFDVETILGDVSGCVTSIARLDDGWLAGVFAGTGGEVLFLPRDR
jgi:glucose/arabinose dehydrogenase